MRDNLTRKPGAFARPLLVASRWFIFASIALTVLLLSAGNFHVPSVWRQAPIFDLGLTSLAMVSYYGIAPQYVEAPFPGRGDFMFKLYQFPNAFGWECAACKTGKVRGNWVYLSGVTTSGPQLSFEPAKLMCDIAYEEETGTSHEKWDVCTFGPPTGKEKHLRSQFLKIWHKAWEDGLWYRQSPAWLSFIMYMAAIFAAATVLFNEFLIAYQPHRMKCRCFLGRWCPCPKGTFEEIEALDEWSWDLVRLYYYTAAAFLFVLPALHDTIMPGYFLDFLRVIDERISAGTEGLTMNPQRGKPYLVILWMNVVLTSLAVGFIWMRLKMSSKPKGWLDGQSPDDVPIIREEDAYDPDEDEFADDAGQTRRESPPPYRDADVQAKDIQSRDTS